MISSTATAPARIEPQPAAAQPSGQRVNPIVAKLRANDSACFRVLGASMFPWIRSGDYVFVRRSAFEAAAVGEVILYERNQRLFVHRVLRRSPKVPAGEYSSLLITKGDALDGKDSPVSELEFLGRVTRIHRGKRHIDLDSLDRVLLGKFLALASPASFLIYRPLRLLKHALFT
ncbi:MAG: S24/S26 family peptidase [Candidatus Acidiferrales bacterium]